MYSTLVTIYLIANKLFNYDLKWCLIISIVTSLSSSIFEYFYSKYKLKK